MNSVVALVRCIDYEQSRVTAAIRRGVDLLGGMRRFVSPGERILLKPNLLAAETPECAVTTHPSVFAAALQLFQESGARVAWGDSPGFGSRRSVALKAGLLSPAREMGAEMADFESAAHVSFPDALLAKQLTLSRGALEADGIVSLCKMKTHGLTRITGGVKNMLGCVPGLRKAEYHVKMPKIEDFASALVDICRYLKPRLHIMDGIVSMEGNGPRGGTPKATGVLLLSVDPVALDSVFCRLIRLNPQFVPTMDPAARSGLGTWKTETIDLVGDAIEGCMAPDFRVVRQPAVSAAGFFPTYLRQWLVPRPMIDYDLCTNCGTCVQMCPVPEKAVNWFDRKKNSKPTYAYRSCIRCYCCQEICPAHAISILTPLLGRLIRR